MAIEGQAAYIDSARQICCSVLAHSPLRFVCAGLAGGVKFDDQAVGVGNFHEPAEVSFSRCGVADSEGVETLAPSGEVVDGADAERDRTEAAEGACALGFVV